MVLPLVQPSPLPSSAIVVSKLYQLARHNDEVAISYFAVGNFTEAKRSFLVELRELKLLCDGGSHFEDLDGLPNYEDISHTFIEANDHQSKPQQLSEAKDASVTSCDNAEKDLYLFDRPIALQGSDVPCHCAATATVVLFNMGLIHHAEGLLSGCADKCRRAITFYKQAYSILSQQEDLLSASSTLLLVACALLYNLSHCYTVAFVDTVQAQIFSRELRRLLEWTTAQSECAYISPRDLEFFNSSLMFADIKIQNCKAAPAA